MTNIDYRTTWVQAQQLLLQNPKFINNPDLLGNYSFSKYLLFSSTYCSRLLVTRFELLYVYLLAMDKEDALSVFESHIRELEKEEEEDREREKRRRKRQERKNRDNFSVR